MTMNRMKALESNDLKHVAKSTQFITNICLQNKYAIKEYQAKDISDLVDKYKQKCKSLCTQAKYSYFLIEKLKQNFKESSYRF